MVFWTICPRRPKVGETAVADGRGSLRAQPDGPVCAFVFKTVDQYGRFSYFKVLSVNSPPIRHLPTPIRVQKLSRISPCAAKTTEVTELGAGDIGAVAERNAYRRYAVRGRRRYGYKGFEFRDLLHSGDCPKNKAGGENLTPCAAA